MKENTSDEDCVRQALVQEAEITPDVLSNKGFNTGN